MELKVEKLVTTEKIDGTTEEKVVLKGEDGPNIYTLTITGADIVDVFDIGEPYRMELNSIQTRLGETDADPGDR